MSELDIFRGCGDHIYQKEGCPHCTNNSAVVDKIKPWLERHQAEAAKAILILAGALAGCSSLFFDIRGDWTDPRHECRQGLAIIDLALEHSPTVFMRDRNPLASAVQVDGHPRMCLQTYASVNVWLTEVEALALAAWIIDTFGETP